MHRAERTYSPPCSKYLHGSISGGKNPALRTFYYRLLRLLSLSIRPLLVFDGPSRPTFKRGRRTQPHGSCIANTLVKQLLALLGIPYHDAPGEAEAECALLQQQGIVDAVLSEDVDTLMFGCRLTLRNWSSEDVRGNKTPTHVFMFDAEKLKDSSAGLSPRGMLLVALMSGGDYDPAGLPGCGVKVACEAARAGFGESLCQLSMSDIDGLRAWRESLSHELQTNESRFFRVKHQSIQLPSDFPDRAILGFYLQPAVSSKTQVEQLKAEIKWNTGIDVRRLRDFVATAFDWRRRSGAIKFVRGVSEPLLNHSLLEDDPSGKDHRMDMQVKSVEGRRVAMAGDGLPELCITYLSPGLMIEVGLDTEESANESGNLSSQGGRSGTSSRSPSVHDEADEAEAQEKTERRQRAITRFDPGQPQRLWISEKLVRRGAPAVVQAWEQQQRQLGERRQDLAKLASEKAAAKVRKARGGMNRGAMDPFVQISKSTVTQSQARPVARDKDQGLPALDFRVPSFQGMRAPKGMLSKTATAPARVGSRPDASRSRLRPSKVSSRKGQPESSDSVNPWTLSKRPPDTLDFKLPPGSRFPALGLYGPSVDGDTGARPGSGSKMSCRSPSPSLSWANDSGSALPPSPVRLRPSDGCNRAAPEDQAHGRGEPTVSVVGPSVPNVDGGDSTIIKDDRPETIILISSSPAAAVPSTSASRSRISNSIFPRPSVLTTATMKDSGKATNRTKVERTVMLRDSLDGAWRDTTPDARQGDYHRRRAWKGVEVVDLT